MGKGFRQHSPSGINDTMARPNINDKTLQTQALEGTADPDYN